MKRIIYGAGMYGKLLLEHFSCEGIAVDYFVQTNEPMDNKINGIEVISFANKFLLPPNILLIVCLGKFKYLAKSACFLFITFVRLYTFSANSLSINATLKNMEEYGFLTTQLMEMFHNCSDISGIISTINNFNKQWYGNDNRDCNICKQCFVELYPHRNPNCMRTVVYL